MSEQPNRELDGEEQKPVREPYTPPRLVRHGTVGDLTRGLGGVLAGDMVSAIP